MEGILLGMNQKKIYKLKSLISNLFFMKSEYVIHKIVFIVYQRLIPKYLIIKMF